MAGEKERLLHDQADERARTDERARAGEHARTVRVPRSSEGLAELHEIETMLRRTETRRVEPSLERWAEFNDDLMQRAAEPAHLRPLGREWRRRLLDRLWAGDSFVRENPWLVFSILLLAVLIAVFYLAL
jgi:hypothetical protein